LPLSVVTTTPPAGVVLDAEGGFTDAGIGSFSVTVQNTHGQTATASVTVNFPTASGLVVNVVDGATNAPITDYRWIIEEDKTFYIDPTQTTNAGATCTGAPGSATCPVVPTLGVNFHTSHMPYVAWGCTGPQSCEGGQTVYNPATLSHVPAVCDVGDGACRPDPNVIGTAGQGFTPIDPSQVALDPTKRYYISVLPGDAANPFYNAAPTGHGMGGAPIGIDPYTHLQQKTVTVLSEASPYPAGKLSVFVFEDDFPLNGEHDAGGAGVATSGADTLAPNEPGLGGFQIHLWDAYAGNGDFTGQITTDMFNQPLGNSLDGTIDPLTGKNACPITTVGLIYPGTNAVDGPGTPTTPATTPPSVDVSKTAGITGQVVTCPKYESDGVTLSPLAGQAVIANLYPGRWGVIATPGADRIARGEEWLQTNTLDGQKAHDAFTRIGEPNFFQEFGPASFHVSIGFANPTIINARLAGVCNGTDINITGPNCNQDPTKGTVYPGNTVKGLVTGEHLSRTPDERLYSSGSHDAFAWSQCYVSMGDADGEDFAFTKCDADGHFTLTGIPDGDWRITVFDQWNDALVDGLSTPVRLSGGQSGATTNVGDIATTQWETNLYTRTFVDDARTGVATTSDTGIPFNNVAIRLRDGSLENLLLTDFTGTANFNETFPLFSWYTVETDVTRYKNTGTHVVYDAGGPPDGSPSCGTTGYPPCGNSTIGKYLANTVELVSVPTNLRVPGAIYCAGADCTGKSMIGGSTSDAPSVCTTATTAPYATTCSTTLSTGRIDPPWVGVEGFQGFPGQNNWVEFGKAPYFEGENGGIKGHVIYASTRPFDDPQQLVQTQWEPLVPNVTINLYQEGFGADGVTPTLKLVDTTTTSSWDDWAQGVRADGVTPNMNCPGQGAATGPIPDLFFFSLFNQPNYLDVYNNQHSGTPLHPLPNNSQFKCYDGMHNWNQIQPAPYDGMYKFPSVTATDANGKPTLTGTNCTICVPDPAPTTGPDADPLRAGIPMLPAGKYVVEVVLPQGYELVKEEDKNILIGDNFIAPVAQEFGGLGNVFVMPDQASVAGTFSSGSGYNANNAQQMTQALGTTPNNGIVPGFVPEPTWPCVGEARIVPDYISLFPQSLQIAPFAGAKRNLCDRKEVTLGEQSHAIAKFFVYTSAHIAAKFTGGITDDYTSEFDPFSPQFGEKFSPPDLPVSVKDWTGAEINRIYADHWGAYNGMQYSTWEVNVPNPTGYGPQVSVMCMNDPGPILDTNPASPTLGQMITDPLFTQGYSQFCYQIPFMPGATAYLDTPVVPTSAFAGAGYNNVDCAYPAMTPAIKEVDGDQVGPWVSAVGHTLTITALGDQMVPNNAYNGPSATTAPYNQKTILRHYGFGTATGTVTIGGQTASVTGWSDLAITVTVPTTGVPACPIQQQTQYGGSAAQCGELVITAANGKQSIDTVNVTIGGKAPTHVAASGTIQTAIDAAQPGDLLMIDPTCTVTSTGAATACVPGGSTTTTNAVAAHNELLLMWKPLRLQGVGAASSIINANTHPAGKMDPWRRQVNCLFGLAINGQPMISGVDAQGVPILNSNVYDPKGKYTCPSSMLFTADRLPLEGVVGWDATTNGNLAEQLQEPSLMGALEGAAITVLSKGVAFPPNSDVFGSTAAAATPAQFPDGTVLLTAAACTSGTGGSNPYPSNFWCNPSSIDGLGLTNSSQGGGAIFVHGWGHNIQIANNRVYNNAGTLGGGINIGQGEFPSPYVQGSATNAPPGSCESSTIAGMQLPYCQYLNVNVHHNNISLNSSTGDELFSATPAGAGGVNFCTGADNYKFQYNWVCGNLSTGDGGGLGHLGFSQNGDIEHNTFRFNQSQNPTIAANGGGLIIMGAPDADPPCSASNDQDCVGNPALIGPSDGVGPNLVINANLIMGNAAETGTGGGIAFQSVNGSDVVAFPTTPANWHHVTVTNNIIVNNVAGWDGAGISLQDALNIDIVNNTIMSNTSTAIAGILFDTIGAPLASQQGTNCRLNGTTSCPQPSGLVTVQNDAVLMANLPATVTCPAGHAQGSVNNGTCRSFGYPLLDNNVFWQNASFNIGVGALSPAFQQNVITMYNSFTETAVTNQTTTGQCVAGTQYWDIGVRGDTGPGNHASTVTLAPNYSILTSSSENGLGSNDLNANPNVVSQYCNGSRMPPEACSASSGGCGWAVPAGIADATVPNPVFNLVPVATVDEGNNWVNLRWGPLSMVNPATSTSTNSVILGNYAPAAGSPAIDYIPAGNAAYTAAPSTDFFGNLRKTDSHVDVGAVEYQAAVTTAIAVVTPDSLTFSGQVVGTTSAGQALTLRNDGSGTVTGINVAVTAPFSQAGGSCGATLAPNSACTINIVFTPTATGAASGTATITSNVTVNGSPVSLSGTGTAAVRTASVSPTSLAFGNWATGTTSNVQTVTVINTGNVGLAGGTYTFGGGTPQPFSRVAGTAGGTCGATLAVNASCTINVVFTAPTTTGAFSRTLAVAYTGATMTGSPVTLTGTSVATRAALTISPNPLRITLATGANSGSGTITLTNSALAGGAQVLVGNITVSGGSLTTYFFGVPTATNNCSGVTLAPQGTCTVRVTFTNTNAARGADRSGTITFNDNGASSPQTGSLIGHANP